MQVLIKKAISENERRACMEIREHVFIDEQNVPEDLEKDAFDKNALFLIALLDNKPAGTCRICIEGNFAKLERVAVLKEVRGLGIGKSLILKSLEMIKNEFKGKVAKTNAQAHALAFYRSLGWEVVSKQFMEAGIPHFTMLLKNKIDEI
jgi:predicted GNAT family N-acyltransferase